VIRVRKLNGVGQLDRPDTFIGAAVPPLIGGATAALTTIGISRADNATKVQIDNAPWIGLGASAIVAMIIGGTVSKPAGLSAFVGGMVGSLAIFIDEWSAKEAIKDMQKKAGANGVAAIVPEYADNGMGAVLMEPTAGRRARGGTIGGRFGEDVQLNGVASVNSKVFGTPGFQA
jgi:hypothetical protein